MNMFVKQFLTRNAALGQGGGGKSAFSVHQRHPRAATRRRLADEIIDVAVSAELQRIPVTGQGEVVLRVGQNAASQQAAGEPEMQLGEIAVDARGVLVMLD